MSDELHNARLFGLKVAFGSVLLVCAPLVALAIYGYTGLAWAAVVIFLVAVAQKLTATKLVWMPDLTILDWVAVLGIVLTLSGMLTPAVSYQCRSRNRVSPQMPDEPLPSDPQTQE
jgi:hypothetical protein